MHICEYANDLLYLFNPAYQLSAFRIPFRSGLNPAYDLGRGGAMEATSSSLAHFTKTINTCTLYQDYQHLHPSSRLSTLAHDTKTINTCTRHQLKMSIVLRNFLAGVDARWTHFKIKIIISRITAMVLATFYIFNATICALSTA